MADPIVDTVVEENKKKSSGVFGGGEDIFDNKELFHPVEGVEEADEEKSDLMIGGTDDIELKNNEDLGRDLDDGLLNTHTESVSQESFDPIFTEDEVESEKVKVESEKPQEIIEGITNDNEEENNEIQDSIQKTQDESNNEKEENIINEDGSDNNEEETNKTPDINLNTNAGMKDEIESDDEKEYNIIKDESVVEKDSDEEKSDLIKKFDELIGKTRELYEIAELEEGSYVELLGGNDGIKKVIYNLWLLNDEDSILISRTEENIETQEEEQNNLQFVVQENSLQVILDEVVLYDEEQDLKDDVNKKMQVSEKLNKFIFLIGEELKVYEREAKEKKMMEEERRKLRDIFRNF